VKQSVCARPVLRQVTDRETGEVHKLVINCGSTRESLCPPCAKKARRLRMQQCAEGWHLEVEPLLPRSGNGDDDDGDGDGDDSDEGSDDDDEDSRRVRSTRRRTDTEDLPRVAVENRSVGQTFAAPDGTTYRPSMFVTLTLGSYGRVVSGKPGVTVRGAGTPRNAAGYDYRRAALEAMHFPKLFDRWMQNLRRCAGFRVQYFGAIEPQRRLAPHIHVAMRGAIPREVIRVVTRATYLQLWWPGFEEPVYVDEEPAWDPRAECYRAPDTAQRLPTWDESLDAVGSDPSAEPALVMRFGRQVDIKGIIAPSKDAERSIRYLTKYLTKGVSETYSDPERPDPVYEAHIDRLHAEVLYLPCSPECGNWLRYGVQPKNAGPGLAPGLCPSKTHDRENLGVGGRRVQVSRAWSGKTLKEHRADRATVVREVLAAAGIEAPNSSRLAADVLADDGRPRFIWEEIPVSEADYVQTVLASVVQAQRWRAEYEAAKQQFAAARGSPAGSAGPVDSRSATTSPRAPDSQPIQVA